MDPDGPKAPAAVEGPPDAELSPYSGQEQPATQAASGGAVGAAHAGQAGGEEELEPAGSQPAKKRRVVKGDLTAKRLTEYPNLVCENNLLFCEPCRRAKAKTVYATGVKLTDREACTDRLKAHVGTKLHKNAVACTNVPYWRFLPADWRPPGPIDL